MKWQCMGMFLALHGAMVTQVSEDGEGDLLQWLREEMAFEPPIYVTLDMHANVTEKMMKYADFMLSYREYPHTDSYETGRLAAKALYLKLNHTQNPVMAWCKLPLLMPAISTFTPPLKALIDYTAELEQREDVLFVRFVAGFTTADIYESGRFGPRGGPFTPLTNCRTDGVLQHAHLAQRHILCRIHGDLPVRLTKPYSAILTRAS